MIWGLAAALGCAVAYGVATVLQAVGSRRLAATQGLDLALVGRLVRSGPYLTGLALDGVGFVAAVVALRSLPLFLVQSAIASSVGVTALVAARWLRTRLGRAEIVALALLGAGLLLLAASAQAESGTPLAVAGQWVVLLTVLPLAALAAAATRWRPRSAAPALAAVAGLGFGGVGIAARALVVPDPWWHAATQPLLWALVAHGGLALFAYAAALQRGSATVVAGVTFAVETVVPAVVGIAVLGDRTRPGLEPVAVVGLVLTVGAAAALARAAEGV